jgi:anti-sigma factor RsiW
MSAPDRHKLLEALQRGRLTPLEEAQLDAYLSAHPAQRSSWEEELALNTLLDQLPQAPVPSNFTARVIQAAGKEAPRRGVLWRSWASIAATGWLPKVATAAAVLALGLFSYQRYETVANRKELAENLIRISQLAPVPSVEVLADFDAIVRLNQVPQDVDRELLAALQ